MQEFGYGDLLSSLRRDSETLFTGIDKTNRSYHTLQNPITSSSHTPVARPEMRKYKYPHTNNTPNNPLLPSQTPVASSETRPSGGWGYVHSLNHGPSQVIRGLAYHTLPYHAYHAYHAYDTIPYHTLSHLIIPY